MAEDAASVLEQFVQDGKYQKTKKGHLPIQH